MMALVLGVIAASRASRVICLASTPSMARMAFRVTAYSSLLRLPADESRAAEFLRDVDSAAVYHNVSTRFTDGAEFGMGAEIGISTQKLHARGPLGVEHMVSSKYVISGNGHKLTMGEGLTFIPFESFASSISSAIVNGLCIVVGVGCAIILSRFNKKYEDRKNIPL